MATDATGTPTTKGIPKYNTAADAPSGLGFNAAMDAIDTLLDGYIPKPTGIVTGEVPVWNGTAFVRSSVTRINTVRPQDLGQDGASSNQVLAWNGSIWAPATISTGAGYGTSLPGSPANGDEYILVDSTTNPTYQWQFRYNSGSSSSYKWEFLGGVAHRSAQATVTVNSLSYATTNSPAAITVPRAGEYEIGVVGNGTISNNAAQQVKIYLSYNVNGAGASNSKAILLCEGTNTGNTEDLGNAGELRFAQTLAASDSLQLAYVATVTTNMSARFYNAQLYVHPIRVS